MTGRDFAIPLNGGTLPGRLFVAETAAPMGALFVFAHGAGAGQASPFMQRYAQHLAALGVPVATFDFPYMAGQRKMPDRPPILEQAFRAAVDAAIRALGSTLRAVVVGGKSMGGRMATHVAAQPEAWTSPAPLAGAVAFGYPLKPPGPRGGDRVSHLARLSVPLLVVQGTRDTFGGPADVEAATHGIGGITVLPVPTGDHSLKVQASGGRTQADADAAVLAAVAAWIGDRLPAS